MLFTLEDCSKFCYVHQLRWQHGVFRYKSTNEWDAIIVDAAKRNKLYIVENPKKELIGICIATEKFIAKVIYVHEIVCIENAFKTFVRELHARFPGYKVQGTRKGEIVTYSRL